MPQSRTAASIVTAASILGSFQDPQPVNTPPTVPTADASDQVLITSTVPETTFGAAMPTPLVPSSTLHTAKAPLSTSIPEHETKQSAETKLKPQPKGNFSDESLDSDLDLDLDDIDPSVSMLSIIIIIKTHMKYFQ